MFAFAHVYRCTYFSVILDLSGGSPTGEISVSSLGSCVVREHVPMTPEISHGEIDTDKGVQETLHGYVYYIGVTFFTHSLFIF